MSKSIFNTIFSFLILTFPAYAQPYVVNEQLEKIFSEGFTDVNSSFPITSSSNPKFWATYGDGYYYMERKITSPRAIVADFKAISKNLAIKTKIQLGPVRSSESSVGVMFLVQPGGKGGFLFEINRKKSFRIKDLSNGAFITKEGENGWIKSKVIAPATRSNTIEIKGFRGKFDIYINNLYLYSFINNSYQSGKSGVYLGQNASARMYYFNLYELSIPGAPVEVNLENLQREILLLKEENDSLKTLEIQARFGGNNKGMISAIKILEEQISSVNEEKSQLNKILKEYKDSLPSSEINDSAIIPNAAIEKISSLSSERDSLKFNNESLNLKLTSTQKEKDSVSFALEQMKSKMKFLESHLEEVKDQILEIKNHEEKSLVKDPSKPSEPPKSPTISSSIDENIENTKDIINGTKLLNTDSTYEIGGNIDAEVKFYNSKKVSMKEPSKPSTQPKSPISPLPINKTLDSIQNIDTSAEILKADSVYENAVNIDEKIRVESENEALVKEPSKTLAQPVLPAFPSSVNEKIDNTKETFNSTKLLKADSTNENVVNIDEEIGFENNKEALEKNSSIPEAQPVLPASPSLIDENIDNTQEVTNGAELLKADSTYEHTIDIDEEIGFENNDKEDGLLDEKKSSLTPLKSQVIKVKKAVKAEFKD